MIGWFVIDALEFPIDRIELRVGKIHLWGSVKGPTPALDGALALRGADGLLVTVGGGHITMPALGDADSFVLHYDLNIASIDNPRPAKVTIR